MKGERKVETRQKVMRVIMIFALILIIANLATRPISHKEKFDKSIAEEILKEAYLPLIDFVKAGTPVEDEELLLAAIDIRSENDFINLFDNKIDNKKVERFFEELVIEKQDVLYIDKRVYIPTIYDENGTLTNSYIKKYKSSLYSRLLGENEILKEELIIKEKWKISGEWYRRTNIFTMSENGQWVLVRTSGTGVHGFVDSNHNPWSYYWSY